MKNSRYPNRPNQVTLGKKKQKSLSELNQTFVSVKEALLQLKPCRERIRQLFWTARLIKKTQLSNDMTVIRIANHITVE